MTTTGVEPAQCPAYTSDRRPELVDATAYFAAMEDGDGGEAEGWSDGDSKAVLFVGLSFVAGVVVTVLVGVWLVRRRWTGGERLLSQSQSQQAKNSF